jgi:predicted nucleic acid-binding Zn ribbon protein
MRARKKMKKPIETSEFPLLDALDNLVIAFASIVCQHCLMCRGAIDNAKRFSGYNYDEIMQDWRRRQRGETQEIFIHMLLLLTAYINFFVVVGDCVIKGMSALVNAVFWLVPFTFYCVGRCVLIAISYLYEFSD